MILQSLTLHNFKNIGRAQLEFSPKVNCLLGDNGMGKSNLLDAIYFLSFCKSFTGVTDSMLMTRGADFAMAEGRYLRRGVEETLSCGLGAGRRKVFRRGGKEYQRLSEHIGLFPLVMVSPRDMDLVAGLPEDRRRFLDMVISQGDAAYLDHLIKYTRALQQRNSMLRDGVSDPHLYAAVEMSMGMNAAYIHLTRRRKVEELSEIFRAYYRSIAPGEDEVEIEYLSSLNNPAEADLARALDRSRSRDRLMRHTTVGIHRDDVELSLGSLPVRRTASQGQSKTFTIALRLAQYEFLRESTSMKPLLLLDDIFDKLDSSRVSRIVEIVSRPGFGQIFITDTNRRHLDALIADLGSSCHSLWGVDRGVFTPITSVAP